MTSFGKFRGCFRIVSSRAFERRMVRLSAAIRSRVMTWGRLTPPPPASRGWRSTPANAGLTRALLGLWIFHRLLGGGAFERPPPMISAPGRRREKRKAAFESSRKIISKSFRSFFGSGQNWGLQGSKFQNFPKRFFYNKIFNLKDRATNLIPSCLSR